MYITFEEKTEIGPGIQTVSLESIKIQKGTERRNKVAKRMYEYSEVGTIITTTGAKEKEHMKNKRMSVNPLARSTDLMNLKKVHMYMISFSFIEFEKIFFF